MGRSPYAVEVRISSETGSYLKNLIDDVANQFNIQKMAEGHTVPHITLFGSYNTNAGRKAKRIIADVGSEFDVVPYRLEGFDHFQNNVIYVEVVPSPEFRQLRRQLSRRLRGVSYNYPDRDAYKYHMFHVTIARGDITDQFEEIWDYVTDNYSPDVDEYASRITSLRGRKMMHEYDLLQDTFLSPGEAKSYHKSWKKTNALLNEKKSPGDHERCSRLSWLQKCRYETEQWLH